MENSNTENFTVSGGNFQIQKQYGELIIRKKKKTLDNSAFVLSDEDIKKLLDACKRLQDRVMLELMVYEGLRRDEVVNLSARDVDFEHCVLHLKKTKGLREREIPLLPDVQKNLKYLFEGRREGYLLTNPRGLKMSTRNVNGLLSEIGKRAGITHPANPERVIHPHLLRHTFSRRFLKNGGRMEVLQKLLGHGSITTTIGVYGSPSMDSIREDFLKTVKTV